MKRIITYIAIVTLLIGGNLMAQTAQMNVRSQQTAYAGQAFRIVFEVNDRAQNFQMPTLKGLKLVGGPSISSGESIQISNGKASRSTSTSYTIIVQADAEGTANVGIASCMVNDKKVQSRPFSIKINKADPNRQQQQQRRRSAWPGWDEPQQQQQQSAPQLDDKSLIARISINKSNLYQGEEAIISYKIYTQVQLAQYQIDQLPRIKGFWSEDLSENWTHVRQYEETYNGRNYHVAEIRRGAIYPQETGTLKIDPLKTDVVAIVQSRMQRTGTIFDFFIDDPFFSPMQQQAITKSLVSNAPTVQVKPLPDAPDGFAGGVGRFDVKAKSDLTQLRTNEALTYRVTVSGRGNLSLLEVPQIEFPQGLEVYEPRIEDNINKGDNGLSGSRTFEWIIIPQTQGEYDIPALDYIYFDPNLGQYITRHCDPIHIKVAKGTSSTSKSDVKELNSDIHHIKKQTHLRDSGSSAHAGWPFWLLIIIPALGTTAVVLWMRRQQKIAGDEGSMKLQRATKLAKKRLRNAERYLNAGDDERFYEEIYKALWGCIADKFNIQLSLLSAETVKSQLEQKKVNEALKERILQTLTDVDFARFAPGDSSTKKQTIYDEAMNTIMQIGAIKVSTPHREKNGTALALLILLAATLPLQAQNIKNGTPEQLFSLANQQYEQGDYTSAAENYNAILDSGQESWELYFNLGNTYYRLDEIGQCILSYERARQLAPHKREIKDNLALARSKTEDHIEELPSMFLIEWFHAIVGWMSPKGWRSVCVVLWIMLCLNLGIFIVSQEHKIRKTSFITMTILALILIFSIVNTTFSARNVSHRNKAVVTAPMVVVKGSPDIKSVDKFVLHEGTCMEITDQQDQWWQIEIGDGKNGWISSGAERI